VGGNDAIAFGEGPHDEWLLNGGVGLFLADIALDDHRLQHNFLAQLGRLGVVNRVLQRVLRDGGQHRRLGQGQVAGRLAEILLRRRLNAVGPAAVKVGVDVPFKNLRLAVQARDFGRQDDFLDLAVVADGAALRFVQQHVAHKLLGDRAAALELPAGQVAPQGAGHAAQVKAGVGVERSVLDGDRRVQEVLRNLPHREPTAVAAGGVYHFVEHRAARPVIEDAGQEGFFLGGSDALGGRKLAGVVGVDGDEGRRSPGGEDDQQHRQDHRPGDGPAQQARSRQPLVAAATAALAGETGGGQGGHGLLFAKRQIVLHWVR